MTERPAPLGYRQEDLYEVGVSLLVPTGWHRRFAGDDGALSYYFARDIVNDCHGARVGISILVMPCVTDYVATEYVAEFLAAICNGEMLEPPPDLAASLTGGACFANDEGERLYTLMLADPPTNTLYQLIFMAPEADWTAGWVVGKTIVESLRIEPSR